MLSTYDRVLREWRRKHMCGSELRAKILAARLERQDAPDAGEVVPGVVVALTIKRAAEKVAIALFSLALLSGCAVCVSKDAIMHQARVRQLQNHSTEPDILGQTYSICDAPAHVGAAPMSK